MLVVVVLGLGAFLYFFVPSYLQRKADSFVASNWSRPLVPVPQAAAGDSGAAVESFERKVSAMTDALSSGRKRVELSLSEKEIDAVLASLCREGRLPLVGMDVGLERDGRLRVRGSAEWSRIRPVVEGAVPAWLLSAFDDRMKYFNFDVSLRPVVRGGCLRQAGVESVVIGGIPVPGSLVSRALEDGLAGQRVTVGDAVLDSLEIRDGRMMLSFVAEASE